MNDRIIGTSDPILKELDSTEALCRDLEKQLNRLKNSRNESSLSIWKEICDLMWELCHCSQRITIGVCGTNRDLFSRAVTLMSLIEQYWIDIVSFDAENFASLDLTESITKVNDVVRRVIERRNELTRRMEDIENFDRVKLAMTPVKLSG